MLNGDIRPSTLEGVKRLATQIKKDRGIKHSSALDIAANAAQCDNYAHARRILPRRARSTKRPRVFLTVYWFDSKRYQRGRETLEVMLPKPLLAMCSKSELKLVRGFGNMRVVADDHCVGDSLSPSQDYAREWICKAERSLRFMEHSGLKPSDDYRAAYPDRTHDSRLPDTDHATNWCDPASGQFVLIDEPYPGAPKAGARNAWARNHGWHLGKSSWPGMYNPYRCDLYAATNAASGYDFAALMARIDKMPPPLTPSDWKGDSARSHNIFVSPAAKTPQDRRRAKSKATVLPRATETTIPYASMFGGARRRPAKAMPIADHQETGRMIKAVLSSSQKPYAVNQRMDSLRSTLEDWLALEIGRNELPGPEFFDVYYHNLDDDDPYAAMAESRSGVTQILDKLRRKLRAAYPDCAPLREQLNRIDVSASLIGRMKPAASSRERDS